jgi:hypothetical protein
MNKTLKTWTKACVTILALVALVDLWRNWAWGKRLASVFVKKNEDQA